MNRTTRKIRRPPFKRVPHQRRLQQAPTIKPAADVRLKKVFAQIGVPSDRPFQPDPFQRKAVKAIQQGDCLVTAPTGAGKTWIAQQAIHAVLKKGGRSWYASPLKALTNSKLIEFGDTFGRDCVGILTGDRKENSDAPIIVGTTEILRNQLYDAMHQGTDLRADLVVLDEAHFLGDEDRGVVWEETMIYLPHRVSLLLLSATIKNARQIAAWLQSIRDKPCVVIEEHRRPVPLFPLFLHPTGRLIPLLDASGLDRKVKKYLKNARSLAKYMPAKLPPLSEYLKVFRKFDLLPAIFFMKSRADCDAALDLSLDSGDRDREQVRRLHDKIATLTSAHPVLADHRQIRSLKQGAVAAHHAGQLPAWKLVIEELMNEGLLDAVFATSTVAAGVNFPARSVVFLNSDRYNGHRFVPLDATEFHQATGRAGRRGKDHIGFAVIVPGKFMDVRLAGRLFRAKPEAVASQIRIDFSMVLNLLLSHRPEEIEEIFQRSFATYVNMSQQRPGLNRRLRQAGKRLLKFVPERRCTGPDAILAFIRNRKELIQDVSNTKRQFDGLKSHLEKITYLVPGRLFLDSRGRLYCALSKKAKRDVLGVVACRVKMKERRSASHIPTRWFRTQQVSTVLDTIVNMPSSGDALAIKRQLSRVAQKSVFRPMEPLTLGDEEKVRLRPLGKRLHYLEEALSRIPCQQCKHLKRCHGRIRGAFGRALDDFTLAWDSANAVRMRIWNDFNKHLAFLKEEGFVTEKGTLTHDGMWGSKLRLDQPLMIAEGLRSHVFPESDPALLAALVAPFVHDREVESLPDTSQLSKRVKKAYDTMKRALTPLAERMAVRGFDVRPIALWASTTLFAWATGKPWEKVVQGSGIAEGDLSMLVLRTAENLRQIASLGKEYPAIAQSAEAAIDMILREPVVMVNGPLS